MEGRANSRLRKSHVMISMKDRPLSEVYQLLEPGPVVLLTTARGGHNNVIGT